MFERLHLQRHQALSYLQLRLFLYHTDHRILYDKAGRGHLSEEIAHAEAAQSRLITEKENEHE